MAFFAESEETISFVDGLYEASFFDSSGVSMRHGRFEAKMGVGVCSILGDMVELEC